MTFLSFVCLEMFSKSIFSITFPGIKGMSSGLYFSRSSFFKIGVTFILFQVSETSTYCCNLSKIIKNALAMASASSLSIHGCNPSNPTDLCMSSLFKCFLGWSTSTDGMSSLLHTFPFVSVAWASWRPVLAVINETKKALSTSAFPVKFFVRFLTPFSNGLMFSLVFLREACLKATGTSTATAKN